jgi:hypothetical protein
VRRALAALALAACAHAPARPSAPVEDVDDPAARTAAIATVLDGYHAAYRLTWNGARIGEARERFGADARADGGYRFERSERIEVKRGGTIAAARTVVTIDTDERLSARRIVVERWIGPARTRGEAARLPDDGWRVRFGAAPPRVVEATAVPSTLVPLLVAGAGVAPGRAFAAPVLVEGAGLAEARLAIDISPDRRRAFAQLATAAGALRAEAALDERGYLASAGGPTGLASRRVDDAELAAPFVPPEIVDTSAVAVAGPVAKGDLRLRIRGIQAAPPALPDLVAQHVVLGAGGEWDVAVAPAPPPRAAGLLTEIKERTHHVAATLADDLAVAALAPDEALAAGRGDCTAHALVLAALLGQRGYETRLVTGFVYTQGALRRHRWNLVRVGSDWVAVDPMLDEVPASPAHLALAVHGASLDELAFVDDVAFAGWERARAEAAP